MPRASASIDVLACALCCRYLLSTYMSTLLGYRVTASQPDVYYIPKSYTHIVAYAIQISLLLGYKTRIVSLNHSSNNFG